MKNFYRPFFRFILTFICVLSLHTQTNAVSTASELMFEVLNKQLGIKNLTDLQYLDDKTQTMAYLSNEDLQPEINRNYINHIMRLGKTYCLDLFNSIIAKERQYQDGYSTFYHGQDRIFLLFQDMYKGLYEIVNKKQLCDFIMLRIPSKDAGTFKTIQQFLKHYINNDKISNWDFDHLDEVRQRLICLNPSLFGNTHRPGECTLSYFLGSHSISVIDVLGLVQNTFDALAYKNMFNIYKKELKELSSLLSSSEPTKTGVLLQIFIPNKLVNELTYRCERYGKLYYTDKHPEWHPASFDLHEYKKGGYWNPLSLDATQFRLLINEKTLDTNNGMRMFRYYNKTPNIQTYEQKLQNLLKRIGNDITRSWMIA